MIKIKVNADKVIKNFQKAIDLSQDMRPILMNILGEEQSRDENTIRGGILKSFSTKTSPDGKSWAELSAKYFEQKQKKYPGKPTLKATGEMFDSLVGSTNKTVQILDSKRLVFGTIIPYAKFHQMGTDKMPERPFLGFRDEQRKEIARRIGLYLKETMEGKRA